MKAKTTKFLSPLLAVALALSVADCGNGNSTPTPAANGDGTALEKLELRYLGSPSYVDLIELAGDLGYLDPIRLNYVGISAGGPQGLHTLLSGDIDISSSSFLTPIVKAIASGAPVKAVIASYGYDTPEDTNFGHGGFYVLEDSPIHGPRDLIGKKVAVNALGAQMEHFIREYMTRAGLGQKEIGQVELIVMPQSSMEQTLRQRQVDVVNLYGPGTEHGVRKLFGSKDLFQHFTAGAYSMHTRYLAENPNTARHVISGMARAIEWARSQPREEVQARLRQIIAKRGPNESDALIDYWTGYGIAPAGGVLKDEDFQIWIDWLVRNGQIEPNSVEAKSLYTNDFNPYATGAGEQQ